MNYSGHFETFWSRYGADEGLDAQSKGSKREAAKSWEKACKKWLSEEGKQTEDEFLSAVLHGYGLNSRNRKAALKAKQFVPRLPHMTTYLNQFRFEAEFDQSTADLNEQARDSQWVCSCGNKAFGRSESGNLICQSCDLEVWKHERRNTTVEALRKWLPSEMLKRWPRVDGETWHMWHMRVYKQIIAQAKPTSIFKWQPPENLPADEEYFRQHTLLPRPPRYAE